MKVIRCGRLIDGTGAPAVKNAVIVVDGSKIREAGRESRVDAPEGPGVEEIDCTDMTVLPGLIDSHIHLAIGAGSNYDEMFAHSDAHQLMTGVANARTALDSGITTVKDCGARNRVAFDLREASEMGLIRTPRLLLSGRSITMTGGHFYYCNAIADGYEEVKKTARGLLAEGADFIKIMASGGGTRITDPRRPSYSVEELRGAVEVAHRAGKTATSHCHATQAIINAVEAGLDQIQHCSFLKPAGKWPGHYDPEAHEFREDIAREIAKAGISVSGIELVGAARWLLRGNPYLLEYRFENFQGLRRAGVEIIAGTDDLLLDHMGNLPFYLEVMVRGGMTPMEAIQSATSKAARSMRVDGLIGTVERGKEADIIALRGNPLEDARAFTSLAMVMKGGEVIPPSTRTVGRETAAEEARKIRELIEEHNLGRKI